MVRNFFADILAHPTFHWSDDGFARFSLFFLIYFCIVVALAIHKQLRAVLLLVFVLVCVVAAGGIQHIAPLFLGHLAAASIGMFIFWNRRDELSLDVVVLSMAVGWGVIVFILSVAVQFPINTQLGYTLFLLILIGMNFKGLYEMIRFVLKNATRLRGLTLQEYFAFAVCLFIFSVYAVYAILPERGYDALVMHLLIPTTIASHGRWDLDFRHNITVLMPAGADWIYSLSYVLGGEIAAKLSNFSFFSLLCAGVFSVIRCFSSLHNSLLLTALFASTPLSGVETATLFTENILAFFCFFSVVVVMKMDRELLSLRHGLALGILLGAAIQSKVTGIFFALPLGAYSIYEIAGTRARTNLKLNAILLFASAALVSAAPPYLIAYLKTGNPIFPFFNEFFKSPYFAISNFNNTLFTGHFSWRILIDMTFCSSRFLEGGNGAIGLQYLLIPVAAAVLLFKRHYFGLSTLLLSVFYFLSVSSQQQYLRYIYPVLPLFTVVIGCAVGTVASGLVQRSIMFMTYGMITFNLLMLPSAGWILREFELSPLLSDTHWQSLLIPQRRLIRTVNATHGSSARVLFFDGPVGAGLLGVPLYAAWYNPPLMEDLAQVASERNLADLVAKYQVTHIILPIALPKFQTVPWKQFLASRTREVDRAVDMVLLVINPPG